MKKFSVKLVVSALVAAAVASMTAVSVCADYHSGYSSGTTTPTTTTTTTTDTKTDTVAAGVVTEENVKSTIEEAVKAGKSEVVVKVAEDAAGKVTVQEAVIADIVKAGIPVTFEVTPVDGIAYSVTIDPATIKDVKAINIGMQVATGSQISALVADLGLEVPVNKNNVVIMPEAKGKFGMELAIKFPASEIGTLSEDNAFLFYIADNGNVSDVTDQLTFDADGCAIVTISHASAYLITDVDVPAMMSAYADDDADEDDDDDADVDDDFDDDSAVDGATDNNPTTGAGIALGALAVSAAAVAVTAKKRK